MFEWYPDCVSVVRDRYALALNDWLSFDEVKIIVSNMHCCTDKVFDLASVVTISLIFRPGLVGTVLLQWYFVAAGGGYCFFYAWEWSSVIMPSRVFLSCGGGRYMYRKNYMPVYRTYPASTRWTTRSCRKKCVAIVLWARWMKRGWKCARLRRRIFQSDD